MQRLLFIGDLFVTSSGLHKDPRRSQGTFQRLSSKPSKCFLHKAFFKGTSLRSFKAGPRPETYSVQLQVLSRSPRSRLHSPSSPRDCFLWRGHVTLGIIGFLRACFRFVVFFGSWSASGDSSNIMHSLISEVDMWLINDCSKTLNNLFKVLSRPFNNP